ncbi:MAG: response regulator transcription factor [Anaerolineae bacterium]|nr:response regulator transcription factor [Anaerolineae bacterium]
MGHSIKILIVDDHPKVLSQIETRLAHEGDFKVVGKAADAKQAVDCALACQPEIILIDPVMDDGMGLEAIKHIMTTLPSVVIVVLTAFVDTALQMELGKIGVQQILEKGVDSQELIDALRKVAEVI